MNVVWGNQVLGQMGKQFSLPNYANFPENLFAFSMWFFLLLRFYYTSLSVDARKQSQSTNQRSLHWTIKTIYSGLCGSLVDSFFPPSSWHFTPLKRSFTVEEILRPTVKILSSKQPRNLHCWKLICRIFVMLPHFYYTFARK